MARSWRPNPPSFRPSWEPKTPGLSCTVCLLRGFCRLLSDAGALMGHLIGQSNEASRRYIRIHNNPNKLAAGAQGCLNRSRKTTKLEKYLMQHRKLQPFGVTCFQFSIVGPQSWRLLLRSSLLDLASPPHAPKILRMSYRPPYLGHNSWLFRWAHGYTFFRVKSRQPAWSSFISSLYCNWVCNEPQTAWDSGLSCGRAGWMFKYWSVSALGLSNL